MKVGRVSVYMRPLKSLIRLLKALKEPYKVQKEGQKDQGGSGARRKVRRTRRKASGGPGKVRSLLNMPLIPHPQIH